LSKPIDQSRLRKFGSLELLARQVVEGFITGLHKSPFHGFSVEFAEHRLYNPGESIRNIDWKVYGRTDRLYSKKFEEETNLRCQIIIDRSSSMYFPVLDDLSPEKPNKITFAVYVAAALIYLLRRQRDAVGLSIFSDTIELNTQAKSSSVHHKLLYGHLENMLEPIPPSERKNTFVVDALHQIAETIHKRSLVVILSDMMESKENTQELFTALQHLRHNKHEVILFHVTDRSKELDFEYENRPYRFIDMESGEEIKVHPRNVREKYIQLIRQFKQELQLRCMQYHVDFIESDINQGFDQILLAYLLKREKLL